jgi:hypothetical protein
VKASKASIADWHQLELPGTPSLRGEFRVGDTSVTVQTGNVLMALDAHGLRHILIPIAPGSQFPHDRRSGGVYLITRSLADDGGAREFIDLACQKAHLNSIFAHMADEVLRSLRVDNSDPFKCCRNALQRWRELLDRENSTVLSAEALCGLFGELWHLSALVTLSDEALNSWNGPLGARHDFAVPGLALEVKSTLSRDRWEFRIHGLAQLDMPNGTALFLSAMRLELNGPSGNTIPELLAAVMKAGADQHELLRRLSAVGYDLRDEPHYEQFRFHVLDQALYEVSASFPRLVQSSFGDLGMPAGVLDVHYTIDLAQASTSQPVAKIGQVHTAIAKDCHAVAASAAV